MVGMTIRITDPVDLVSTIPYQLGFHPRRSVVVLAIRGGRLGIVQRADLDPPPAERHVLARQLVHMARRDGAEDALVVVFDPNHRDRDPLADAVIRGLQRAGVGIVDHFVVSEGRIYFPMCDGGCHPAEGMPLPPEYDVPAVVEYVALGRAPVRDRDALKDLVSMARTQAGARCEEAVDGLLSSTQPRSTSPSDRARFRRRAARAWLAHLRGSGSSGRASRATPSTVAVMAISLLDKEFRDAIIGLLCPGCLPLQAVDPDLQDLFMELSVVVGGALAPVGDIPTLAELHARAAILERLSWLSRHTPDVVAPGVLTVLAAVAWAGGDGALALTSLDRALAADPEYTLALLLERMVTYGIRLGESEVTGVGGADEARAG